MQEPGVGEVVTVDRGAVVENSYTMSDQEIDAGDNGEGCDAASEACGNGAAAAAEAAALLAAVAEGGLSLCFAQHQNNAVQKKFGRTTSYVLITSYVHRNMRRRA